MVACLTRAEVCRAIWAMAPGTCPPPADLTHLTHLAPALLFIAVQVILGMVSNPLGDVAPKGVAPPNLMPRHEPMQPHLQGQHDCLQCLADQHSATTPGSLPGPPCRGG